MKARIAIVCISSLISLVLVATAGCAEPEASLSGLIATSHVNFPTPTPEPTAAPSPVPTPEPTPTPTRIRITATPWPTLAPLGVRNMWVKEKRRVAEGSVGGERLVYDEKIKGRMFDPTPTPKPTNTPEPTPTPTPNPFATPTPVPDDFEFLTDENVDKAARVLGWWGHQSYPYLNDVRLTRDEIRWLSHGLGNYTIRYFMERCLDGLEYPPLTQELAKQVEFRGWTMLEFLRDGSKYDYDEQVGINPDYVDDPNWYTVRSLYRTGEDSAVMAYMGLKRDTCEPRVNRRTESGDILDFRMEERKLNENGHLACWDSYVNDYTPSGCRINGWVQVDRWKWYDPITDEEIETGRIKCRGAYILGNPGVEWAPTNCPVDDTP